MAIKSGYYWASVSIDGDWFETCIFIDDDDNDKHETPVWARMIGMATPISIKHQVIAMVPIELDRLNLEKRVIISEEKFNEIIAKLKAEKEKAEKEKADG